MPQLSSANDRATRAVTLAQSFNVIHHNGVLYLPTDYETGDTSQTPPPERTAWVPLDLDALQRFALDEFDLLFQSYKETSSFHYMVSQAARQSQGTDTGLLLVKDGALMYLDDRGQLAPADGRFVPNFLRVPVATDQSVIDEMFAILVEWLDGEQEALSLLRHLATSLAPGWPAIRYVLLLGDGRNGKSVLMTMLQRIFGAENCSHITRQDLSKQSPVVTTVQGKLLNLVFDGVAEYLKDSGTEKSLIAGEPVPIRLLYSSVPTLVSTNALFVEGLNREPRSSDKTSALQARLVRFWFPNVYADDEQFKARMTSPLMVGALLALMIQHYVKAEDKAVMLTPTRRSQELKLEHMNSNSMGMQFLEWVHRNQPDVEAALLGKTAQELTPLFLQWRYASNDMGVWSESDVMEQLRPVVESDRRSVRSNEVVRKTRVTTRFKPDALAYLTLLEGEVNEVVGD